MLRAIITAMAISAPWMAVAQQGDLMAALSIDKVMDVMAQEGMKDGEVLRETLLPQAPASRWRNTLSGIYDPQAMSEAFQSTFMVEIDDRGGVTAPMTEFFMSPLGSKVVAAELEARGSLLDDAAEDRARLTVEEMRSSKDPRLAQLQDFAEANDLIEMNVAGALNASLAFSQGLQAAGGLDASVTEQDLLRDAWAQEPLMRGETEAWLYPYLVTAYSELTGEEMDAYTAFSRSRDGQTLNVALFAGFDEMYRGISRQLGSAMGREINGRDI